MPVQRGVVAMSTTRRRRATLRLNVKVVIILISRKETRVCQSQDIQKSLLLLEG